MRIVIAAALVIFSLVSYYSMGDINLVTDEKQRVAMNTDQEIAMGLHAALEMTAQHGELHPDQRTQELIDRVCARLLAGLNKALGKEGRKNLYRFDFHLWRDDRTVNAFTILGGQMFDTYGLFSRFEADGQFAGVLRHEIGHVLSRQESPVATSIPPEWRCWA